jgi:amino acid transporter
MFILFLQHLIPILATFSTAILGSLTLFSLALLNIIGVHIGGKIQKIFISFKILPILFVIITGMIIFWSTGIPTTSTPALHSFVTAIPIGLFAIVGFEIICSVAHFIKKPERNIKRAIVISSLTVACVAALFQLCMYIGIGPALATSQRPILSFGSLVANKTIGYLLDGLVFTSIIGSSFGMLTGNAWNLHALGKYQHFPFSSILTKVTTTQTPWISLLIEASIGSLVLSVTTQQVPLQNIVVFTIFITFFLTAGAALSATLKKQISLNPMYPILALVGCSWIGWLCIKKIHTFGFSLPFLTIFAAGLLLALVKEFLVKK